MKLKENHSYFFQVKGAKAISGVHTTDFIVWTPTSMKIQEIKFDAALWEKRIFPELMKSLCYLQ